MPQVANGVHAPHTTAMCATPGGTPVPRAAPHATHIRGHPGHAPGARQLGALRRHLSGRGHRGLGIGGPRAPHLEHVDGPAAARPPRAQRPRVERRHVRRRGPGRLRVSARRADVGRVHRGADAHLRRPGPRGQLRRDLRKRPQVWPLSPALHASSCPSTRRYCNIRCANPTISCPAVVRGRDAVLPGIAQADPAGAQIGTQAHSGPRLANTGGRGLCGAIISGEIFRL